MTRHSKQGHTQIYLGVNERTKVNREYGREVKRISEESMKAWHFCSLCLSPAQAPVLVKSSGLVYCRECMLEDILVQNQKHQRVKKELEDFKLNHAKQGSEQGQGSQDPKGSASMFWLQRPEKETTIQDLERKLKNNPKSSIKLRDLLDIEIKYLEGQPVCFETGKVLKFQVFVDGQGRAVCADVAGPDGIEVKREASVVKRQRIAFQG